jgi:D-glycero-D-manno-heptose 1,7-bisphosphate phosphatase
VVTRAVFLDRDGVINANLERAGKPVAPTRMEDFRILPGVEDAVRMLKAADFLVVIVTNQPDVRTGHTPKATVEAMHAEIRQRMPIDHIKVCFHVDADSCDCRKPKPGMLLEAAAAHDIDLKSSYLVGDRWRDVVAGGTAGCLTIFVDYGYEQDGPNRPDKVVRSLPEAVAYIIDREHSGVSS